MSCTAASLGVEMGKLIKDVAGGEQCLQRLEGKRVKTDNEEEWRNLLKKGTKEGQKGKKKNFSVFIR